MTVSISAPIASKKVGTSSFIAAAIGTIVEFYDYGLYGFAASLLAAHFFPPTDPTVAFLQVFGVFAVGSLAKPLGALFFGWLGDKYGRRLCLRITMLGIVIPTTTIALVPGYEQIGWVAPLILLLCRFTQGFFMSGESDGVRLFIFESVNKKRVFFANSLIGTTAYVGIYMASSTLMLVQQFPLTTQSWLWRIPFILGGILGLIVIFLRKNIVETTEYEDYQQCPKKSPLRKRQFIRGIMAAIFICGSSGGVYHILFVFMPSYLSKILEVSSSADASFYTNISLFCFILAHPIAGLLSDKWGGRPVFVGSLTTVLTSLILTIFCFDSNLYPCLLLTAIAFGFHSSGFVMLMQQFPVNYRFRCISAGHTLGSMLFSGSAPALATGLWKVTAIPTSPLIYCFALMIMSGVGIILVRERK